MEVPLDEYELCNDNDNLIALGGGACMYLKDKVVHIGKRLLRTTECILNKIEQEWKPITIL